MPLITKTKQVKSAHINDMKGHLLLSWKLHGIFHPHNLTKSVWGEKFSWFLECLSKSQGLCVYLSVAGIQLCKGCMRWHPWAAVGHISSMGSMCPIHGLLWEMEHTCNPVSSFGVTWLCPGTSCQLWDSGWDGVTLWALLDSGYCMRDPQQCSVLSEPWWYNEKMAHFICH